MLRYFFVLLSFISLSFAYDFKDSFFNEYLVDELRNENSASELSFRFKRDADPEDDKCSLQKNMHCCKSEKVNTVVLEAFKKAKTECFKEITGDENLFVDPLNCENAQKIKENLICTSECVAKKFDVVNENGDLDREKIVAQSKIKFSEEPWKLEKTEEIVDKCLAEVKNQATTENSKCNSQILKILHCMWKEFVQNCPKEMQIDSMRCNKIRDRIENSDDAYLKALHYHRLFRIYQQAN